MAALPIGARSPSGSPGAGDDVASRRRVRSGDPGGGDLQRSALMVARMSICSIPAGRCMAPRQRRGPPTISRDGRLCSRGSRRPPERGRVAARSRSIGPGSTCNEQAELGPWLLLRFREVPTSRPRRQGRPAGAHWSGPECREHPPVGVELEITRSDVGEPADRLVDDARVSACAATSSSTMVQGLQAIGGHQAPWPPE